MSRSPLLLVALACLLMPGCGEDRTEVSQVAQQAGGTTRGRHRVRQSSLPSNRKSPVAVKLDVPIIAVALLERDASSFQAGRDPFRYGEIERKVTRREPPPPRETPRPQPVDSAPAEPAKPIAPPFTHTYLGSFGPRGLRIAVFEDNEGTIINAFEGEVLEGKFKVLKIGYESVDIEFVGFPDTPAERKQVGG